MICTFPSSIFIMLVQFMLVWELPIQEATYSGTHCVPYRACLAACYDVFGTHSVWFLRLREPPRPATQSGPRLPLFKLWWSFRIGKPLKYLEYWYLFRIGKPLLGQLKRLLRIFELQKGSPVLVRWQASGHFLSFCQFLVQPVIDDSFLYLWLKHIVIKPKSVLQKWPALNQTLDERNSVHHLGWRRYGKSCDIPSIPSVQSCLFINSNADLG